jgi:hypothetical protein
LIEMIGCMPRIVGHVVVALFQALEGLARWVTVGATEPINPYARGTHEGAIRPRVKRDGGRPNFTPCRRNCTTASMDRWSLGLPPGTRKPA